MLLAEIRLMTAEEKKVKQDMEIAQDQWKAESNKTLAEIEKITHDMAMDRKKFDEQVKKNFRNYIIAAIGTLVTTVVSFIGLLAYSDQIKSFFRFIIG